MDCLYTIVDRQNRILEEIKKAKKIKANELAELLGVSERTIRSHVKHLKKIYPNIVIKQGRFNGGIYWEGQRNSFNYCRQMVSKF